MLVFVIMGCLAAFAGIVKPATLSTAAVSAGTGNELDVIAAVVIGGANLAAVGSVIGAVLGAAMMACCTTRLSCGFPAAYPDGEHRPCHHLCGHRGPSADLAVPLTDGERRARVSYPMERNHGCRLVLDAR